MPIKRRTPKRAEYPINAEAVAAYRAGDSAALATLWKLKPWQVSCPIYAVGVYPFPRCEGTADWDWWHTACELHQELAEAAGCEPPPPGPCACGGGDAR